MAVQQHIPVRAISRIHETSVTSNATKAPAAGITKCLLGMGVAGSVLFTVTWLAEGATRPGYDAVRQPISALSLGPGGWVQAVSFLLFSLTMCCSTIGYRLALAPGLGATTIPVLRLLASVGLMLDGIFPQDPSNGYPVGIQSPLTPSFHGSIHQIAAIIAITALSASCIVFAGRFAREPGWRLWAPVAVAAGLFTIVFITAFGASMGHGPAGVLERCASGTQALFSLVVSTRLIVGTGRMSRGGLHTTSDRVTES